MTHIKTWLKKFDALDAGRLPTRRCPATAAR